MFPGPLRGSGRALPSCLRAPPTPRASAHPVTRCRHEIFAPRLGVCLHDRWCISAIPRPTATCPRVSQPSWRSDWPPAKRTGGAGPASRPLLQAPGAPSPSRPLTGSARPSCPAVAKAGIVSVAGRRDRPGWRSGCGRPPPTSGCDPPCVWCLPPLARRDWRASVARKARRGCATPPTRSVSGRRAGCGVPRPRPVSQARVTPRRWPSGTSPSGELSAPQSTRAAGIAFDCPATVRVRMGKGTVIECEVPRGSRPSACRAEIARERIPVAFPGFLPPARSAHPFFPGLNPGRH